MSNMSQRFVVLVTGLLLGLAASGCTTGGPKPDPLEQQIANAKTRADHESLAAWYEQDADTARKGAEYHRQAMQRYKDFPYSGLYSTHHVKTAGFVQRCESAIRSEEQLAEDDLALAELHHALAAEAKE